MKLYPFFLTVLITAFVSCATGPVVVPDNTTPTKIIQMAQEAMDTNRYETAIAYYEILLERYGNVHEYYCTGEYEIAFINYKQKNYAVARQGLEQLLVLYNAEGGETLPRNFKVLAEKVLASMTEKGF